MSLREWLSGATKGVATQAGCGVGPIEALCRANGWDVDEREGTGIVLYFQDPVFRRRLLYITASDNSPLVAFASYSLAKFDPEEIPDSLACLLLLRNRKACFHSWRLSENDDGSVGLAVQYMTLSTGLLPSVFKSICEEMCKDAGEIDAKLQKAGLI